MLARFFRFFLLSRKRDNRLVVVLGHYDPEAYKLEKLLVANGFRFYLVHYPEDKNESLIRRMKLAARKLMAVVEVCRLHPRYIMTNDEQAGELIDRIIPGKARVLP